MLSTHRLLLLASKSPRNITGYYWTWLTNNSLKGISQLPDYTSQYLQLPQKLNRIMKLPSAIFIITINSLEKITWSTT
jgi:hypothetical protein